jgi:3-deoxy-D-manno-octulosonic-acid transferase
VDLFSFLSHDKPIWIHAVSVGEMKTAATLIKAIRMKYPESRFVISNITNTGRDIALSVATAKDVVIYFPVDVSFVVKRLVTLINPKLFLFVETELWPNLISELHRREIPVVLVNGRISPRSFRNYRLIRPVIRGILDKITILCMRTEEDAARARALGAADYKVIVSGNMKFDGAVPDDGGRNEDWIPLREISSWLKPSRRLFVAGSTHRGEDAKIVASYKSIKREYPKLQLLIAPRHIERTDEIARLIRQSGFTPVKLSEIERKDASAVDALQSSKEPIFILDSMGRLNLLYRIASIVFVGGSLIPHGGHNFLEPAVHARPMITGSHVHNFKDMFELFLKRDAIKVVHDEGELATSLKTLLDNDKICADMGERAKGIVLDNLGSTGKNIALLDRYLS